MDLFWGPQKQKRKNNHNSTNFWAKNKIRTNFWWDKLEEFLLFNEVLKNVIFFSLTHQKSWLYNTKNEQISNSKSLFVLNFLKKSWIYCLHFLFWVLRNQIFELLRPSRTSVWGKKRSNFGFLTFKYALKN